MVSLQYSDCNSHFNHIYQDANKVQNYRKSGPSHAWENHARVFLPILYLSQGLAAHLVYETFTFSESYLIIYIYAKATCTTKRDLVCIHVV